MKSPCERARHSVTYSPFNWSTKKVAVPCLIWGSPSPVSHGLLADCSTWEDAGESDGAGEIHYGLGEGNRSLIAGPRIARCLYRVQHGNTQASALVRVVQIAGLPADDDDASLSRIGGLEPPLANRAQAPAQWSEETASQIRLEANDANGNPAAGLRMWIEAQNCWVSGRVFTLNEEEKRSSLPRPARFRWTRRLTARY